MSTMSITAAIREASRHCTIAGAGTSWHIYGPYRVADLRGPSTELHADSYTKALRIRTGWRAEIALVLMGRFDEASCWAVESIMQDPFAAHDLRSVIESASATFTGARKAYHYG